MKTGLFLTAIAIAASTSFAQKHSGTPQESVDYKAFGAPITKAVPDQQIAAALKAVSSDRLKANIARLVDFSNRSTISSTETDLKPGTGVLAAADWIKSQFELYSRDCGGCLEVHVDEFIEEPQQAGLGGSRPRILKPTPLRNVYAILRGTDPAASKRMYLVTGHYDTRETDVMDTHSFAPGANDDSSGTAVSMESARVLSKYKFPATIVFVAVAGEEQGLNGSHHLSLLAKKEGWQLEGVLNNDIVGGDTTPGETLQNKSFVRIFSQGILPSAPIEQIRQMLTLGMDNDSPSRELAREVLDADRTYFSSKAMGKSASIAPNFAGVMELRLDRYLRGGDHKSFSDEGFPAVRFTEWRENYDHQHQHVRIENGKEYGDLLKFDDFNYIANVARLNMATLATLANSPGIPQNVRVVTSNLDNRTILKWSAPSAFSAAAHYQIVWRETASTDWQYAVNADGLKDQLKMVDSEFAATLPVSKDNVYFGIRACDAASHCSAAVAPIPERTATPARKQ
ncbi:M28 family peptidase [Terriglobus saanensis]|uniref:Peptidase M28 n=1 Tax=Terriglobus saanensis (strain ATCC BAA-1853 / DSM 23119 / SP1PR4) TaxID=401053 RepID=E8V128_TERSS|nr:M28 family peptidase [Terriglobus saanensis]ADV83376.1 peptidase M28 [Terriglobus saanensis SP1PR4]